MRVMQVLPPKDFLKPVHLNDSSRCAMCGTKFRYKDGIIVQLHTTSSEYERDEDNIRHLKRVVGSYAYHSLVCFLALVDVEGCA